jgi:aspartyl protease family protein
VNRRLPGVGARTLLVAVSLALLGDVAAAAPQLELQAVLGQSAVLQIDGVRRVLRVGQSSPEGVRLVSVDAGSARVQTADQTLTLPLGGRAGGALPTGAMASVRIARDDSGMFLTQGAINGRPLQFLVDTGATTVAMNDATARSLGIDYRAGERGVVQTASGVTEGFAVTLREVSIGSVRLPNVKAVVIRGQQPNPALLGMSFLSRTQIEHAQDALVLKRKY